MCVVCVCMVQGSVSGLGVSACVVRACVCVCVCVCMVQGGVSGLGLRLGLELGLGLGLGCHGTTSRLSVRRYLVEYESVPRISR